MIDAPGFVCFCVFFGVGHRVHAKIEIIIMRRPDINTMGVNELRTRRCVAVHLHGMEEKNAASQGVKLS